MTRLRIIALAALACLGLVRNVYTQPLVSNVVASQRPDDSGLVDVTYDLTGADNPVYLSMGVADGPTDENLHYPDGSFLSGDVGGGILPGEGRTITWDARADLGEVVWPEATVVLTATEAPPPPPGAFAEFVSVPASTFTMGRTDTGDDATFGTDFEDPRHEVTLSAYEIGRFEVTNAQFAEVMNWALARGRIVASAEGDVYNTTGTLVLAPTAGDPQPLAFIADGTSDVEWTPAGFLPVTRPAAAGLEDLGDHPVHNVTWYGAVAFCNFLSEREGRPRAYDLGAWELVDAEPGTPGVQYAAGYRLPTESEWERAAAWDGSRHWIYGVVADDLPTTRACLLNNNPVGLAAPPFTSPVGFFDGSTTLTLTGQATVDSPSPVGAYDMAGNVWEWCHDRGGPYTAQPKTNPTGPAMGDTRTLRGGGWFSEAGNCRSAQRLEGLPFSRGSNLGFRLAITR